MNRATRRGLALLLLAGLPLIAAAQPAGEWQRPAHPDRLVFDELVYQVPDPADYRADLSNGIPVFLAEDRSLPLISLSILIRTGDYLVPAEKAGLAGMVGYLMRQGGTRSMTPEEVNEKLEFLAAGVSTSVGETQAGASLNCLTKDFPEVLAVLVEILKEPRFDEAKLEERRGQILQNLERRNDRTASIEGREWTWLMRGREHFSGRYSTKASIEGLTREDLVAFHQAWIHPGNFILSVSGDFDRKEMLARLEAAFTGWPGEAPEVPPVPAPTFEPRPGLYVVHKDVNQGRVRLGHAGIMRDNPDYFSVLVMNDILGGGGFVSRITSRVRSDEGLAYSAGSSMGAGVYYPGTFRAGFQSKTRSCARAAAIILEEIERIRSEKVSEEELLTSRNSFIEILPRYFESKGEIVGTFANDLYTGRDPGFWRGYRQGFEAVDAEAVLAAAKTYLHPDKLVILAVGDAEGLLAGDPEHPDYQLSKLGGEATRLALPDPLTLVRPEPDHGETAGEPVEEEAAE
jgi:predicted Zn-dependent peptidase